MNQPGERAWSALLLQVPSPVADDLLALLAPRSLGAWSEGGEGNRSSLRIYFVTQEQAEAAHLAATDFIERSGSDPARCECTVLSVPDERWLERYQAGLRPFPFGNRFIICPTGEAPPAGQRIPIRLVPGRAFGTGEHPTTRLCGAFLESRLRPGERWIDLGCGSGILALVALACGAAEVLAVDADPEAVEVARDVFEVNGAPVSVRVCQGTTSDLPGGWEGIVANILASFFLEQARALAHLLGPGGTLIASGFDSEQTKEVEEALCDAGLRVVDRAGLEDWRALACIRPVEGND